MARKITTEEFILQVDKIHNGFYSYDKTEYKGDKFKVEIYCHDCNKYFWQVASNHKQGNGCPLCSQKKVGRILSLSKEEFIKRSNKIHNYKYDYSNVNYINAHKKVKIFCKKCNEYFTQTPTNHLDGKGHKNCCHNCFSPKHYGENYESSLLYIISLNTELQSFYKIGITSETIERRFRKLKNYKYNIIFEKELSGFDARTLEIKLHKLHKKYKLLPKEKFDGYTECFSRIDLPLIKKTIEEYLN